MKLHHEPTGVTGAATERRSPTDNQRMALFRLRVNLALGVRAFVASEPSDLWRSRCRDGRVAINPRHHDYPAVLAEALDVIEYYRGEVPDAAQWLGCTTSQLLKLIKTEPRAFQRMNERRQQRGRPRLL